MKKNPPHTTLIGIQRLTIKKQKNSARWQEWTKTRTRTKIRIQ